MNHKQRRRCTLWLELERERCLRLNVHTHQALVRQCRTTLQVEQHRHVILVVGDIETRDIDQRIA